MGGELPRVTQILRAVGLAPDFSAVSPAVIEAARARGTAVHALLEAEGYGYLDPADVSPALAPYLDAYRKFVAESGHEAIASEIEVIHPEWQYVGHIDRVGWLLGKRVLLDWKSGTSLDVAAAGYQLGGYRLAWNASHPTEPVAAAAVVHLRDDSTYRLHEIDDLAAAEQTFLAAVIVYRALPEAGRITKERAA